MLKSDISTQAGNGLVHVVDRVLFPPTVGDVVETLQVGISILSVDIVHGMYTHCKALT